MGTLWKLWLRTIFNAALIPLSPINFARLITFQLDNIQLDNSNQTKMCQSSLTTSSPATEALEQFMSSSHSNKRVKRSTLDSPQASFSFDMTDIFAATAQEDGLEFPSIEWGFGDDDSTSSQEDLSVVSALLTKKTCGITACKSDSSLLGKRSRGLSRSKTLKSSIDLLS